MKLPNQKEIDSYQNLPSTLTIANPGLRDAAFTRGFHEWAKETIERWEVPPDHPGQNRRRCFESTLQAANSNIDSPPQFYDSYKKLIERAFYLTQISNGFVHPTGFVAAECGYYQGQEGDLSFYSQ